MHARLVLVAALAGVAATEGCRRRTDGRSDPGTTTPAWIDTEHEPRVMAASGPPTLRVDDETLVLAHGHARFVRGLVEVELTREEKACDEVSIDPRLRFTLGPGPEGAFFAGEEIGLYFGFSWTAEKVIGGTSHGAITLDALNPTRGAHVTGLLRFERGHGLSPSASGEPHPLKLSGSGRFDVTLCNEDEGKQSISLPGAAPKDPLRLEIDGTPRKIATALALATRGIDGTYYTLAFYSSPIKCVNGGVEQKITDKLEIVAIGRAYKEELTTGSRQPASAWFTSSTEHTSDPGSNAWVRLHAISPTTLSGELVARTAKVSGPALTAGGQFEATICGEW